MKPTIETLKLDHDSRCGVYDNPDFSSHKDCTCGAAVYWYETILQAIFDPENQPSQFGTELIKEDGGGGPAEAIEAIRSDLRTIMDG